MVFDDTKAAIPEEWFLHCEQTELNRGSKKNVLMNAPEPRGNAVQQNCFVDVDHVGNKVTHHSHTGIIIFLNFSPTAWISKCQNIVEMSTFGSEFVALHIAMELLKSLSYKLGMFCIPLVGQANVFCNNEAVVKNTTMPESTLKKKHNLIAYHHIQEAVTVGVLWIMMCLTDIVPV